MKQSTLVKQTWYLHGVPVTEEEFNIEPEKIDIKKYIIDETNIQRRMAFLNKVGMELFYKKMGTGEVLDEEKNENGEILYQLLKFSNKKLFLNPVTYLYMRNPSIGVYHLEGVGEEIKTIEEALHWRKPDKLRNIPVDNIKGGNWYQQGDVCIWDDRAKSLKNRPSTLT